MYFISISRFNNHTTAERCMAVFKKTVRYFRIGVSGMKKHDSVRIPEGTAFYDNMSDFLETQHQIILDIFKYTVSQNHSADIVKNVF